MMRLLKFFKAHKLKNSQRSHKTGGFTLIELLVGMILVSLIITPLLGLVINMMDTDRKEQAKATSEQEIQAALDYIARDLDQAFFIYDSAGLSAIESKLPDVAAADPDLEGEPVLVFWKREFLPNSIPLNGSNIANCANNDPGNNCDDGFVYSLVGYYLVKDPINCINSPWSCTTRISRIELKDALYDVNNPDLNTNRTPLIPGYEASDGLVPIDQLLEQPGSLEEQLTNLPTNINWAKAQRAANYNYGETPFVTLIDYIDQTPGDIPPASVCSQKPRPGETAPYPNRQVPDPTTVDPDFPIDSFYACVSTDQTVAQVFIRGNALARIRPKNPPPVYAANQSSYFPRASIQAQGSGLLNVNPSQ